MRVRFTRPALADLEAIFAYVSKHQDEATGSLVVTRLIERAMTIGSTPHEGRQVDEPNSRVVVLPRLRYFIFYTITGEEVHITHIRHTSRRRLGP